MSLPPDIKRTYFQNRFTGDELVRLLAEGRPFVLENVGAVDPTTEACRDTLAARGLRCRVDDRRRAVTASRDILPFLAWPIIAAMAIYETMRALAHRRRHPDPDVVIVKQAQSLDFRFRKRKAQPAAQ